MNEVIEFKMKPKEEPLVYSCGGCGGQLWYVEYNPSGNDLPCVHRCFKCGSLRDIYQLFYSAEDDE